MQAVVEGHVRRGRRELNVGSFLAAEVGFLAGSGVVISWAVSMALRTLFRVLQPYL